MEVLHFEGFLLEHAVIAKSIIWLKLVAVLRSAMLLRGSASKILSHLYPRCGALLRNAPLRLCLKYGLPSLI